MGKQLYEKFNGEYNEIFPLNYIQNIIDEENNTTLWSILKTYNNIYIPYQNNVEDTRNLIPVKLRRKGLWITYQKDNEYITEYYKGSSEDIQENWANDENWEVVPNLNLVQNESSKLPDGIITPDKLSPALQELIKQNNTITNLPDDEDLEERNGVLSFKDRKYNQYLASGKGYKILRKNWVKGRNILTQDMINETNTIYEIRYDFDLNSAEITIPEGCVLKFEGGSLNNGTINGNNTNIINENIFCKTNGIFSKYVNYNSSLSDKIFIENQKEFDNLIDRINNNENINAVLSDGVFIINKPIIIKNNLTIIGSLNTVIKGNNLIFKRIDAIDKTDTHYICDISKLDIKEFSLFVDRDNNIINISESVDETLKINITTEAILRVDDNNIKIKIPDNLEHLKNKSFEKAFGYLDSWYRAPMFKLKSSDNDYFYCELYNTITEDNFNTFVNGEKTYYNVFANFVLYNTEIKDNYIYYDNSKLYIPNSIDYIECINYTKEYLINSDYNGSDIIINNVKFENIKFLNIYNLFDRKYKCSITNLYFLNNHFFNIVGTLFNGESSENICNTYIYKCNIKNCSLIEGSIIFKDNNKFIESKYFVSNCFISRYYSEIPNYKNTSAIITNNNQNYKVINCEIINTSRDNIYVNKGNVNIISNILYNTSSFLKYPQRNASRDAGFIYVNHYTFDTNKILNNKEIIVNIKYNKIYNVLGKGDVRGIFIDNGRGDVICIGNVILSSQLYSIDSRIYSSNPASSCRNIFKNNILASKYRLEYSKNTILNENIPISENNILLYGDDNKININVISDKRIKDFLINENNLFLTKEDYDDIIDINLKNIVLISNIAEKINDTENYKRWTGTNKVLHIQVPLYKLIPSVQAFKIYLIPTRVTHNNIELIITENNYKYDDTTEIVISVDCNFNTQKNLINYTNHFQLINKSLPLVFSNINENYIDIYVINIGYDTNENLIFTADQFYSKIETIYKQENYDIKNILIEQINYSDEIKELLKVNKNVLYPNYITINNINAFRKILIDIKKEFDIELNNIFVSFYIYKKGSTNLYFTKNNDLYDLYGNLHGILTKGTTSQRPTLTSNDSGFEYYDSTLKKKILWNGAEWTNLDGTVLT